MEIIILKEIQFYKDIYIYRAVSFGQSCAILLEVWLSNFKMLSIFILIKFQFRIGNIGPASTPMKCLCFSTN